MTLELFAITSNDDMLIHYSILIFVNMILLIYYSVMLTFLVSHLITY